MKSLKITETNIFPFKIMELINDLDAYQYDIYYGIYKTKKVYLIMKGLNEYEKNENYFINEFLKS